MKHNGKHAATASSTETRGRRWRNRAIGGGALGMALALGTAWAIYEARAPMDGSVDAANMTARWVGSQGQALPSDGPCSATIGAGGVLAIGPETGNGTGRFYPGSTCTFTGKVAASGGKGRITGIKVAGVGEAWKVAVVEGCGNAAGGTSVGTEVKVAITLKETATGSAPALTFDKGADGVRVTPTEHYSDLEDDCVTAG